MDEDLKHEMMELHLKLNRMHEDIRRFIERSNQEHLGAILDSCRSGFAKIVLGYAADEIDRNLNEGMVSDCQMLHACKSIFSRMLNDNICHIGSSQRSDATIAQTGAKLDDMKQNAPYSRCESCFSSASQIFDKQKEMMRSIRLYRERDDHRPAAPAIQEERAVNEILGPVSNRQRLQIMKALQNETMTFSSLSALTGLRGGNLLFHLDRLLESGMILQRHERGDYMITKKGFKTLRMVSELLEDLEEDGAKSR